MRWPEVTQERWVAQEQEMEMLREIMNSESEEQPDDNA